MSKGCGYFSYDIETGDVVAKTVIHEDGSVNRYEYTVPDDIKGGHGDTWYDSYQDFVNDEPAGSRDKDDSESINRSWYGNGHKESYSDYKVKKLSI